MATKPQYLQESGTELNWGAYDEFLNSLDAGLEDAPKPAGVFRTAGDMGLKLAQGAVDLGASAVGLGNIATGGLVGQGMDAIGYDPKQTNEFIGGYLSDAQKASDKKVQNAQGFVGTLAEAVTEPRFLAGAVTQSIPGLLAMGGIQKAAATALAGKAALATTEGAAAAAGKTGAQAIEAALATDVGGVAGRNAIDAASTRLMAIGAGTEGAQTAGSIAQEAQHAGRHWTDYAPAAVAAGVGTGAIGYGAGKLMGDAGTKFFTGAGGTKPLAGAGAKWADSLPARMAKSGFSEGFLEEMPQSSQEEVFRNIAMGKDDIFEGVDKAAATGLVTGGAMGLGMGAFGGRGASAAPSMPTQTLEQLQAKDDAEKAKRDAAVLKVNAEAQNKDSPLTRAAASTNPLTDEQLAEIELRSAPGYNAAYDNQPNQSDPININGVVNVETDGSITNRSQNNIGHDGQAGASVASPGEREITGNVSVRGNGLDIGNTGNGTESSVDQNDTTQTNGTPPAYESCKSI